VKLNKLHKIKRNLNHSVPVPHKPQDDGKQLKLKIQLA